MPKNRIHKGKDGRYFYHYTDASGKPQTLASRSGEIRAHFSARYDAIDAASNNVSMDIRITYSSLFLRWVDEYQSHICTKADAKVMQYIYDTFLKSEIGHLRLHEITRAHIYKILAGACKKGLKKSTVSKIRACVSRPFNWAINSLHLEVTNPTSGLVMRYGKSRENQEIRTISDDDMSRFFAATSNSKYQHYFVVLRETGMRPSECLGLEKKNRSAKNIQPESGFTAYDDDELLKSSNAYRKIPITPACAAALDAQERVSQDSKWYFPTASGEPSFDALKHAFDHVIRQTAVWKKIGRKYHGELLVPPVIFSLYDFRHTFATKMAASGMPMKTLQYIMGHADIATTMRYYVAMTDDALLEAGRFMAGQSSPATDPPASSAARIVKISGR